MNKKSLLGKVLVVVVVLIIITSATFYFNLKRKSLQITTGKFVFDIQYNSTKDEKEQEKEEERIIEVPQVEKGNLTKTNFSLPQNASYSLNYTKIQQANTTNKT